MKQKFILLAITFFAFASISIAQSDKYVAAMKKNLLMADTSIGNPQTMLSISNNMERIAIAEKDQWLPYYYAALYKVNATFAGGSFADADPVADAASVLADKAEALSSNNSEISVLRAMISTLKMLVNPQARFMQYGMQTNSILAKAEKEDPTNPRPNYLRAENVKNTPEQFGGGCNAAADDLKSAVTKFAAFKPASDIAPNWGLQRTESLVKECGL